MADYVEAFDSELQAKDKRLAESEVEISRLNAEIRRLSAGAGSSTTGFLALGKEHDLYPQEIRDQVVAVLQSSLRTLKEGSRKQDVLFDVLEANPPGGAAIALDSEVKSLLRTYRSMDARLRSQFIDLGFAITEDGKHYKLTFRGDPRYMFTLPKTSSDHRAGKNVASDITSTLF